MTNEELEQLAKAATPGDFDSADHTSSGSYECPCCSGDGQVEGKTLTNFDGYAMGVQFFGIGNEFANYEAFARAANPATILALLSERAELLAAVERMRGALEPFALAADNMDGDEPDSLFIYDSPESAMIDYADLRRARAAADKARTASSVGIAKGDEPKATATEQGERG
jgi:hypothetical protein